MRTSVAPMCLVDMFLGSVDHDGTSLGGCLAILPLTTLKRPGKFFTFVVLVTLFLWPKQFTFPVLFSGLYLGPLSYPADDLVSHFTHGRS